MHQAPLGMDQPLVAAAYGLTDIDLDHGFHETKLGLRYTIGEGARRRILDRLLALNHQRHEEEVRSSLQDKKVKDGLSKRSSRKNRAEDSTAQSGLY